MSEAQLVPSAANVDGAAQQGSSQAEAQSHGRSKEKKEKKEKKTKEKKEKKDKTKKASRDSAADSPDGWVKVAELDELADGARKRYQLKGREITIVRAKGKYFAIDTVCYHAGGDLSAGAVQDIEDASCIVCPIHSYCLRLDSGEALFVSRETKKVMSLGKNKQRTHSVEARADGICPFTHSLFLSNLLQDLSCTPSATAFASDAHAFDKPLSP